MIGAVMARRMKISPSALDRLFDPNNASVSLDALTRAAAAVGREIRLELDRGKSWRWGYFPGDGLEIKYSVLRIFNRIARCHDHTASNCASA